LNIRITPTSPANLKLASLAALGLTLALAGCSGGGSGGDGDFCLGTFEGGTTSWGCNNCYGVDPLDDVADFDRAIDNHSGTYRAFGLDSGGDMTIRAQAPAGMSFPAGVDAGALMRFPSGTFANISVRFNVYRDSDLVNSQAGGATAAAGNVPGAGEDYYYTVSPTMEFDRLDAVITVTGNNEPAWFRMIEFCGDH